jgi:hypothetical protein
VLLYLEARLYSLSRVSLDDYNPALSLQPGVRLGLYEIVAPVGAGGMGEVYRAHDPALNRDVALKILPDAFAADPDRLARFTREAQVLASLNHPHIAFKTDSEPNIAPTARLSPDGSFLAYSERQPTGEFELFVTRFPSGEGRWQISTGGGRTPRWIRETNELVFVGGTGGGARQMMSVPIAVRPTLVPGPAVKLFDLGDDFTVPGTPTFDVTADGKRFLMVRARTEGGGRPTSRWVLIQNWLAEFPAR